MYPRPLLRTIKGEAWERIQDTRYNTTHTHVVELPYSISIHLTPVFTPVQALRCKIIQTRLPPLDVGPSLALTMINLCVFSCITIWKGEHAYKFTCWCDPPGGKHRQLARQVGVLRVFRRFPIPF